MPIQTGAKALPFLTPQAFSRTVTIALKCPSGVLNELRRSSIASLSVSRADP